MIKILNFPKGFKQSRGWLCGPCAMQAVLFYYGKKVSEKELAKIGKTSSKEGTSVKGMARIAKKFNLKYLMKENLKIKNVIDSIKKGNPVILGIQAWPNKKITNWKNEWEFGHYVIAIGYDSIKKKIIYHDPFDGKRKSILHKNLDERWHDRDAKKIYEHLGIVFSK